MQRKIKIKNKTGLKLAVVVEAPDFDSEYPVVIISPGFTGYKEENHLVDLSKGLLDENIASIRFDYRGFGESSGTLEKDYRFSNFIEDGHDVIDWAISQKLVDRNNIFLVGFSMGGQIATILATDRNIKALCLVSTPDNAKNTDLGDLWGKTRNPFCKTSSRYGDIEIPYEFYEDYIQYDATKYANKISCPLLVIAGVEDVNVPLVLSKRVYDSANQPKKFFAVNNMDHLYKKNDTIVAEVNTRIVSFIKKYIQ